MRFNFSHTKTLLLSCLYLCMSCIERLTIKIQHNDLKAVNQVRLDQFNYIWYYIYYFQTEIAFISLVFV